MRFKKTIVVLSAIVAPSLLVMPGVLASADSSMSEQEAAYRAVQEAEAAAQAVAANANEESNAPNSFAPCVRGFAKGTDFACDNVQLLAQVPLAGLGTTFGNDIWGWTAPDGEREWALVGGGEGTAFVEVTDPKRPVVTGFLPTAGARDAFFWRDIKEIGDHAYIGTEDSGSGMQVFDLTRLLDAEPGTTFTEDGFYDGVSSSHNVVAHEDSQTIYLVGSDTCSGGLHAVDVSDSTNPVYAGCFGDDGYVHDAHCVTYAGPDTEHDGKTICVASTGEIFGTMSIVDMTDPANPVSLSRIPYPDGIGYSHQGWLTEDHATYVHGDELDELFGTVSTTTSYIFDVSDLDAPVLATSTTNGQTSIDHNLFIEDGVAYHGNYTSGLRVFDASDPTSGDYPEIAWFDTYPANDAPSFEGGVWGTYPFFADGDLVAVSTIDGGLFLLRPTLD